jgi:hypothetical protein
MDGAGGGGREERANRVIDTNSQVGPTPRALDPVGSPSQRSAGTPDGSGRIKATEGAFGALGGE